MVPSQALELPVRYKAEGQPRVWEPHRYSKAPKAILCQCGAIHWTPADPGMEGLTTEDLPVTVDTLSSDVEAPAAPVSASVAPAPTAGVLDSKRDIRLSTEALKHCLATALVSLPCPFPADPCLWPLQPQHLLHCGQPLRMACCTPSSSSSSDEEKTGTCVLGGASGQVASP